MFRQSFEVTGVQSEQEMFAHAVNALSQDATRLVTDLITNAPLHHPYTALKERLLIAHQLSPIQKAAKILSMPVIGDRRPSQLLADLLEYCPPGEEKTAFFRATYMQRLPADMQVLRLAWRTVISSSSRRRPTNCGQFAAQLTTTWLAPLASPLRSSRTPSPMCGCPSRNQTRSSLPTAAASGNRACIQSATNT